MKSAANDQNSHTGIFNHTYEAFGESGPFLRPARTIGELPHDRRKEASKIAEVTLEMTIEYGVPIGQSNGMTKREMQADSRTWINLKGCDLPLSLLQSQG